MTIPISNVLRRVVTRLCKNLLVKFLKSYERFDDKQEVGHCEESKQEGDGSREIFLI